VDKLRVATVGAGYFSQFHHAGWRGIDEVQCVAIADTDIAKAEAMAKRFAIPRVFARLADMLEQARPNLLDIITPPETHRAIVAAALPYGIPMICQKALAPTYAEALAIADLADSRNATLVVHENFRWQPWYREARRLIETGALGALHSIAFRLRPGDGQGPHAYLDRQPYFQTMPRLLVHETAIHWIDTFRFLMGEVHAVSARLRRINPVIAGEDAGYIVFEFVGGATGLFDGNRLNDHVATNPRRTMGEMWLEGAAGVLRLDGDANLWWKAHQQPERRWEYHRGDDDAFGGGCVQALQRHVVRHLRTGSALENTARDYLVNLRAQEAVYRSHAIGRRIELMPSA
jgi:predicted dehydrogenase